jgi:putative transposase
MELTLRRMSRLPRFFVPDLPLHIIQRGNNRDPIFRSPSDFPFLHGCMRCAANTHGVAVHAYVLMTNHLHVLATPSLPTSIPKMMQSLGRVYVQRFNWRYQRTGTLWEGRYKATIVDDDRYLLSCMRYIELNPVRAGMVETPAEYRWSSFRANAGGRVDPLVTHHPIYQQMGTSSDIRQAAYRALFGSRLSDEDLCDIRDATQNGWALGSASFKREISLVARRAQRSPMGRPREAAADHGKSRV